MDEIRKKLQNFVIKKSIKREEIDKINSELEILHGAYNDHIAARNIIQKAAQLTQQSLEGRISKIVSQALELVFDDLNLGFKVEFVTKRNSTECEMYITEDGEEYDPLSSCGFGAADVASFALRVAMWNMNKSSDIMVFDEPFRNLDEERMPQAALLLTTLSEELGIQMLVVTHEESLSDNSGRTYVVSKNSKHSKLTEVKGDRLKAA